MTDTAPAQVPPTAPIAAPRSAPHFTSLNAGAILKIPLTCTASSAEPKLDAASTPIKRGHALLVTGIEGAHRALAPVDGMIRSIGNATIVSGRVVPAIEFACDRATTAAAESPPENPAVHEDRLATIPSITPAALPEWIERLRTGGVHAHRRASPDLLGQLTQSRDRQIDVVICNLLDSDPAAAANAVLAAQFSQEIVAGASLISRLVGATRTFFCADHAAPSDWISPLRAIVRSGPGQLIAMANDYPQSDATLLLYTVLHRRLKPAQLPTERGAFVLDAAAAFAIGRLFLADEPMLRVPLTVRDHARKRTHFVFAPIGMSAGELVIKLGENHLDTMIRGGDLLRDVVLPPDAVVSGSELVLHTSPPEPEINPNACIRCGWCSEACPTRVQPAVCLEAAQLNDPDLALRAGIDACVECGICSYVCPSKLPLLKAIRQMKIKHEL